VRKNNYEIEYLPSFGEELNEIIYYITYILRNPNAADKLLDNIDKSIMERKLNPEVYEKYKSNKKRKYNWYRIYVGNYMIFYTIKDNKIEMSHILYNKRDMNKLI